MCYNPVGPPYRRIGTTTTLTHPEVLAPAYDLLADGERQIAAGRYREGSASVYQAAITALRAVADARGWPADENAYDITHRLDNIEPLPDDDAEAIKMAFQRVNDPLPVFCTLFINVTCFEHHSRTVSPDGSLPTTFWEPEDYVKSLPPVKKFIRLLASEIPGERAHDTQPTSPIGP